MVSEIVDATEFYINSPANLIQLEDILAQYKLVPQIQLKKGTICIAKFYEDNKFYRAEILKTLKDNKFLVRYIDYGNEDTVSK